MLATGPNSLHWKGRTPKTLIEAITFFSDYENCRQFMIATRWADGVVRCPRCCSDNVIYMKKSRLYFCRMKHAKAKFSLKVGTIYEDSAIGLETWLPATWLLTNCRNGISSNELARAVGVTQKSAWHMLHRIRLSMKLIDAGSKLGTPGPLGNAPLGKAHAAKDQWDHASKECNNHLVISLISLLPCSCLLSFFAYFRYRYCSTH